MRKLLERHDETGQRLLLRERQLALCMTHLEGSKTDSDVLRTRGSMEEVSTHIRPPKISSP